MQKKTSPGPYFKLNNEIVDLDQDWPRTVGCVTRRVLNTALHRPNAPQFSVQSLLNGLESLLNEEEAGPSYSLACAGAALYP